jgi:integrase
LTIIYNCPTEHFAQLTFADILPTFGGMKRVTRSKPEKLTVGNVTVRIYKRDRATASGEFRTVYEVSDYSSGIRRLRGFADHMTARLEAGKIARQIASGDTTAAMMKNTHAASFGRAIELLQPTGLSLELAAAHYAEAFKILGGGHVIEAAKFYARHQPCQLTQRRVGEVVAELVALKQVRGMSEDYTRDLRQRLVRFAKSFSVNISSITTGDVQRWLDGLKLGTQSVKNFRTVLHTLFEFAEARGYVMKGGNPVTGTESIKVKSGEIQIFSPDEMSTLLKSTSSNFLPVLAIGAFAGLRTAEVERIEWRDVDLASGFITVASDRAKTKARRLVPIASNLARWLAPYSARVGLVWNATPNDLQDARSSCTKASGVKWKPNALRHSYASYRLAIIQNAAQVALEMGNSSEIVFKHYRELVKPEAALKWFSICPATNDAV